MTKIDQSPSITDLILATLGSGRSVRKFRSILFERKLKKYKQGSVQVALSRLQTKGYVDNSTAGWSITKQGQDYVKNNHLLSYLNSPFKESSPAHTIIAFDISEKDRVLRRWLRNQLKIFNYKLLQQSLWIGPGPLPASFLKRLEELNIRKNVKTFKITKSN